MADRQRASVCCRLCRCRRQAQRDFFGGHTYERVDREGWFHCAWTEAHKDIGDTKNRTLGELS
jgi:hypothetical protein